MVFGISESFDEASPIRMIVVGDMRLGVVFFKYKDWPFNRLNAS